MRTSALVCSIVLAAAALCPAPARAQDKDNAAAAEQFFQDGRRLMDQKKYADACPKFAQSYKLAPGLGTLLNLGDCYQKAGKTASAWARFREAMGIAARQNRPDREKIAQDRATALEAKLIRLKIVNTNENASITMDDVELDPAVLGTAIPIDPGKHTLDVTAKGKKPFHTTIDASERVKSPTVEIPELEDDAVVEKPKKPKKTKAIEPPVEEGSRGGTQRILGLALGGVGVVGLGVGGFFGLRTFSKWGEAEPLCPNLQCDRTGFDLAAEARTSGIVSTVGFIAGGALLLGGAALYFTAPSGRSRGASGSPVRVGLGAGGLVIGGALP